MTITHINDIENQVSIYDIIGYNDLVMKVKD